MNSSQSPRVIYAEPIANDYTLLPGDELLFEAFGTEKKPWFTLVEYTEDTQVYCNDAVHFRVSQNGKEIECGHNRRPGTSAWPST
jgi:hypothetical protein